MDTIKKNLGKSQIKEDKSTYNLAPHKPLLLWPGVVAVTIQWLVRFGIPMIIPGDTSTQIGIFAGLLCGLVVIIWWAFFSRAPRTERWVAIGLIVLSLIATPHFIDISIKTAMMGLMFTIYSIPVMCLALVAWAVATRHLSGRFRIISMVATILIASGVWTLLRTNGMDGSAHHDFEWRWAKTPEELLINQTGSEKMSKVEATNTLAEWPGFRGPNRDGIIHGLQINTDWSVSPPVKMWRRPIGPGCSSFAAKGNLLYTQEQRGEMEVVSCYNIINGEPVWLHNDSARFWDSHAGAGPRSTPTLNENFVFTLGATGILNVLDAGDGSVIWSRDAAIENGVKVLNWGFTGSPLVVDDVVIVSLSGKLAAYDAKNGNPLWSCTDGGNSYSSPHLATIDGVPQIILMSQSGALSVEPASGKQLWKHEWPITDRILQPAIINGGELLIVCETKGIRRVNITHQQSEWTTKEVWTSTEMKLNFNDLIIHKGHAYGFDGPNIACIDISDGKRKWKGDPYRGWLLLLADQDLLLVLSEKGELALIEANPDGFSEIATFPAIEGKTWNHPALAGNFLLVRNSQEMAAFKLSRARD